MKKRYCFWPEKWLAPGLLSVLATCFTLNLQAQIAPIKHWDKTLGGSGRDELRSVIQTSDGGYMLGGNSFSNVSGDKSQPNQNHLSPISADYWILKLDNAGNKLWDKTYGGTGHEDFSSLQQTSDGGYILAGSSRSGINGNKTQANKGLNDFWVLKLDANGNKAWDKTFGGNLNNQATSVIQTADGGYLVGGNSDAGISGDKGQPNLGYNDYWIVKLDAGGNKVWDKTFGTGSAENLESISQTTDGGYILAGTSEGNINGDKTSPSQGGPDYWIIKIDANGLKLWDKTLGGNGADELFSVQQTSDRGFLLGGSSSSNPSGNKTQSSKGGFDYWIAKLDSAGNFSWDKTFGGSGNDRLMAVQQTQSGGYFLSGYSDSGPGTNKTQPSKGLSDFWVIQLDNLGNQLWDLTIGGNSIDGLWAARQTSDNGFILGGLSNSGISGDKTEASKGDNDFWVAKLGYGTLGTPAERNSFQYSIFPNPTQGKFKIQINNLNSKKAEVTISDLVGSVVLQQEFHATNNQLSKELTLPNAKGIYLLQLKTGNQISTRKIVVE